MVINNHKPPWHESDEFWVMMAPLIFDEERLAGTTGDIDQICQILDLELGDAILDMGCGLGRHSLELARRGFNVTGVDRTETYLKKAREAARREGLEIDFFLQDMRKFNNPNVYFAAISLYSSFGYFEDQSENQLVLDNIYRSLKLDGVFILDMMGKEVLARNFIERTWQEEGGTLFLLEHKISRNWSWRENRWIMVRDGKRHEFHVSHWAYSAVEIITMLEEAGFQSVEIYGSLDRMPYDQTAKRLVAVAQK